MNCFADLFARFPGKVMDLLLDEADQDNRPVCLVPDTRDEETRCFLCERRSFDNGEGWSEINRTCDSEECRRLWAWFTAPTEQGGYKRRLEFKRHFGQTIYSMSKPNRVNAILATMLTVEAKEYGANQENQRRAA